MAMWLILYVIELVGGRLRVRSGSFLEKMLDCNFAYAMKVPTDEVVIPLFLP